jgi:hypothetical protein
MRKHRPLGVSGLVTGVEEGTMKAREFEKRNLGVAAYF